VFFKLLEVDERASEAEDTNKKLIVRVMYCMESSRVFVLSTNQELKTPL
jgi:hypothetical protein